MKRVGVMAAVIVLSVFSLASSVEALTVVNRDAQAHVLRIIEGDDEREVSLQPSEQADGLCTAICDVIVDDSLASYLVAENAALVIVDGVLAPADELGQEPIEPPIEL